MYFYIIMQKLAHLLSSFVESFRATAQMVSIIGHSRMLPVVEHSGYADHLINPWKLDPSTLKFSLKGNLPYDRELLEPQTGLLRYVLEQPYSRDMVCSMLGLQKQVSKSEHTCLYSKNVVVTKLPPQHLRI
jgi:mediator of RNA polymerase II transcription subunit 23